MSVSRPAAFVLAMSFVFCAATRVGFGAPPDPCSLLTQAQVGDALGAAVGVGKSTGKICRWAAPGGRPGMSPALVLTLQDAKEFDFAKRPSASASLVKTPVSGVGDDAVFNTTGSITATLHVKKGDTYFELHVYGFPVDQARKMETTLAQEVISTLK